MTMVQAEWKILTFSALKREINFCIENIKLKLTFFKKHQILFTSQIFLLCECSTYSHFQFKFKKNNTILKVSKIQSMRKLNDPTTTLLAGLFLTVVRFNLIE